MFMHLAKPLAPQSNLKTLQIANLSRRVFIRGTAGFTLGLSLVACAQNAPETIAEATAPIPDNSNVESGPLVLISIAA